MENSSNVQNKQNILPNITSNEFERIESLNKLQSNQFSPQFDIYKDFEMRELLDKSINTNTNTDLNQSNHDLNQSNPNTNPNINSANSDNQANMEMISNSLPFINDNIRANIKFSIEIYKKINNFDFNYIHSIIESKSK